MTYKLLPHQIEDAKFLASKSFAGNFSGMGSGKTLTALAAIREVIRLSGPHHQEAPGAALKKVVREHLSGVSHKLRVIFVGPPISLSMWQEEALDFFPASTAQIVRSGSVALQDVNFFIMSYAIATKRRDALKEIGAKILICDESHALKNQTAKRTKAVIGRHGICESVDHTWLLSGTPSTRYNDDLFTFMARAGNGLLKEKIGKISMDRFRLRYCITQKKKFSKHQKFPAEVTVGNRNTEELNEMLFDGGMAVRRELADVWATMPPITINHLDVKLELNPDLKTLLKDLEHTSMNKIRMDLAAQEPHLATLRRKLGVAKVKHSAREILDRVEAGTSPILIGAWHTEVIDALEWAFMQAGVACSIIDGRTPPRKRETAVKSFNSGSVPLLIGQIAAMGVSLNLQGGSHIVCVESDFSPAIMDQFFARCHRIGQADHVHVDVFTSDTKLDKAIRRIARDKASGHTTLLNQEVDA